MLYITTTCPENLIKNVNGYFDSHKKKDWFNNDLIKKVIKDIDNTIAVKDEYMESPVFGGMSPDRLSGGCKAVILMYVQDRPIYATKCGDDCSKSILEVAKTKDITIFLRHCLLGWGSDFEAVFLETGKLVHNEDEFVREYYKCKKISEGIFE